MTTSIIAQMLAPFDPLYDLHTESVTPWWIPVEFRGQYPINTGFGSGDPDGDGCTDGIGYGDSSGSGFSQIRRFGDGDRGWGTGDGGLGSTFADLQKKISLAAREALARS